MSDHKEPREYLTDGVRILEYDVSEIDEAKEQYDGVHIVREVLPGDQQTWVWWQDHEKLKELTSELAAALDVVVNGSYKDDFLNICRRAFAKWKAVKNE